MSSVTEARRVVVKVGTSTLTYENGRLNLRAIESLCKVLTDLQNSGKEIVLVSSGAMGVGVGKLGLRSRPSETHRRQAIAAVGQCELMFIYDKLFGEYNQSVAQLLLTRDIIDNALTKRNVTNTLQALLEMRIIPIINENDTVAVDELAGANFGDNDTLSAIVARVTDADLLILLTDIDGLYNADPHQHPDAKRIPVVTAIDDELLALAGGAGSKRGTGGMQTKLHALQLTMEKQIPGVIMNGADPQKLYALFDGEDVGTLFDANAR
jgi:glutamate 5-kinase